MESIVAIATDVIESWDAGDLDNYSYAEDGCLCFNTARFLEDVLEKIEEGFLEAAWDAGLEDVSVQVFDGDGAIEALAYKAGCEYIDEARFRGSRSEWIAELNSYYYSTRGV